jgi:outer membrane protein
MRKSLLFSGLLSLGLLTSSNAIPLVDGEFYGGYISQDPSGWFQYKGTGVDIEKDLGLGREGSYFVKAKLEPSIPFVPNIYLQFINMDFSGTGYLQREIEIDGKKYLAGQRVYTDLKMDHYDIGLYYNVPFINTLTAGIVDLEAGLDVRIIDFEAKVTDDANRTAVASATIPLPLLYVGAEIKPPVINFVSVVAEGKGIKYSNNYYYEFSAEVRFKPAGLMVVDPFVAVGYKYERLRVDDIDSTYSDIKIKQPYIAAGILF